MVFDLLPPGESVPKAGRIHMVGISATLLGAVTPRLTYRPQDTQPRLCSQSFAR